MTPRTRPDIGVADDAGDLLLIVVIGIAAALATWAWLTGELAALISHGAWPPISLGQAMAAAWDTPAHLGDPRQAWPSQFRNQLPGPALFAVAAFLASVIAAGLGALVAVSAMRHRTQRGFASRAALHPLTERAVIARAAVVRPSLAGGRGIQVTDAGVRIGRAVPYGARLACSAEDSVMLLAAPRQGKTSSVVIPWLHSWPGPAICTSIRPDVLLATAMPRLDRGPVAVMAPTGMITWPHALTWDPASGCADYGKAHARADVMVSVGKGRDGGDSTDSGFFSMNATNLLAAWLHAAALSGGTARDVVSWAFNERLDAPIRILATHPGAAEGSAAMLDALYRLPADTTRASLWTTAQTAIAPLLSPAAAQVFLPDRGTASDLAGFLKAGGTCYVLADERRAATLAPVVAAFADDLIETARAIGDELPGGRIDPPLGLFLDEVANIVPLPQLPSLMSFAGGSGIFAVAVLQSMAQARARWGQDAAAMLWGAATVKLILGGLAGEDLREISELCGEYQQTITTWQHGHGGHSLSATLQDRRTARPDEVRTLSAVRREALVIHATTPAVRARLTRHYEGPNKAVFAASVAEARQIAGLDTVRKEAWS
jgi:type IV secretory pathway TraG/TraD family ATPase VirD4